jgi:hypothetical protein
VLLEHTVYTKIATGLSLEPTDLLTALISASSSPVTLKLNSSEIYFRSKTTYLLRSTWTCTVSNSLTHSWSWALLQNLLIVQLLKNFPAFYGTRRFITVFTRALHLSILSKIHFNIVHPPTSWSSQWSLSFWFSHQCPICIRPPPFVLHALPTSSSLTWSF